MEIYIRAAKKAQEILDRMKGTTKDEEHGLSIWERTQKDLRKDMRAENKTQKSIEIAKGLIKSKKVHTADEFKRMMRKAGTSAHALELYGIWKTAHKELGLEAPPFEPTSDSLYGGTMSERMLIFKMEHPEGTFSECCAKLGIRMLTTAIQNWKDLDAASKGMMGEIDIREKDPYATLCRLAEMNPTLTGREFAIITGLRNSEADRCVRRYNEEHFVPGKHPIPESGKATDVKTGINEISEDFGEFREIFAQYADPTERTYGIVSAFVMEQSVPWEVALAAQHMYEDNHKEELQDLAMDWLIENPGCNGNECCYMLGISDTFGAERQIDRNRYNGLG